MQPLPRARCGSCPAAIIGKADIKAMVAANGGSDMLPDAVPLVCGAGDVTIANRQIVHGSFANSSPDRECRSPSGSTSEPPCSGSPASSGWPLLTPPIPSTTRSESGREQQSSRLPSMLARHLPDEEPFEYLPFANLADDYRYEGETIDRVVTNYNLHDLAILTTEPVGTIHAMPPAAAHHAVLHHIA